MLQERQQLRQLSAAPCHQLIGDFLPFAVMADGSAHVLDRGVGLNVVDPILDQFGVRPFLKIGHKCPLEIGDIMSTKQEQMQS